MSDEEDLNHPCCGDCKFWHEVEGVNGTAECRRYPPSAGGWVPSREGEMSWVYNRSPKTWLQDWCGEWKERIND